MAAAIPQALLGHWVHSHEEDTPTEMIFRPANYEFPSSRGRQGFQLNPDGTYVETSPGPDDRPRSAEGRWQIDHRNALALDLTGPHTGSRVLHVESVEPDRLVVRKA